MENQAQPGIVPAAAGRAEYETWRAAVPDRVCNVPAGPWDELSPGIQAGFAAIAAQGTRPAPGEQWHVVVSATGEPATEPLGEKGAEDLAARLNLAAGRDWYSARPAAPKPAPGLAAAAMREAAFAGGMRVRTAPCTAGAHDREHFQVRTNGHWLCGHLLASMLAAQGIGVPQPAPDIRTAWRLADERLALLVEILGHPGIRQVPAGLRAKWHERAGLPS